MPGSIGTEASHGCIRMLNSDIEELYEYMNHGTIVTIYAGPFGPFEKGLKILKPGDRGSAVLEVQRRMKDKGYYPAYIDREFYKKLGIELFD